MPRSIIMPALTISGAILLAACSEQTTQEPAPEPTAKAASVDFSNVDGDVAYVGDDACASCHEEEYDAYQTHGMAQTMERMKQGLIAAEFPSPVLYHRESDYWYRAFESNGQFYQAEFRLNAEGDTTHQLIREMMWVVGSGTIARTFLTVENGLYTELPLTWYTQRKKWDFSPGYEVLNNRFNRAIPDRCIACHNAYPETVEHVIGVFKDVHEGISCERCHGPGDLHVNARLENPDPAGTVDETIVNPKYLALNTRMDVCQQCHVTAKVSILRDGRRPFQFVPTESLERHVALFSDVADSSKDRIAVTSHAKRLRRSACFIATASTSVAMDCVTCHDPHASFRDAGPEYFNATCQRCHGPEELKARISAEYAADHVSGADCTSCHMPKTDLAGVPHSAFTDHLIRVVGRTDASPSPARPIAGGRLEPYFDVDRESPDAAVYQGMAYIVLGDQDNDLEATRRGVAILEDALTDETRFGEAYYSLGLSRLVLNQFDEAEEPLEVAVKLEPDNPERLNTLAQLYERLGRSPERISGLYRHALEIQPLGTSIRVNYGRFLETQGRTTEARRQYEIALKHRPSLATAHYNLGTILLKEGEFDAGEAQLLEAIKYDPDYSEAYGNLGILMASQGRLSEARKIFERGVSVAPDDPVALNNLASFYLNEGMDAEALPLLQRAVEAEPGYSDALANLALAYLRAGDDPSASRYATQALSIEPNSALAKEILRAVN